mmetsp:Transcript_22349/g.57246  ORF Transcript_22349/g.57246 Transcript_22349/m.57246 type:complete len:205 (-) Transcript_22349:32-646(-)
MLVGVRLVAALHLPCFHQVLHDQLQRTLGVRLGPALKELQVGQAVVRRPTEAPLGIRVVHEGPHWLCKPVRGFQLLQLRSTGVHLLFGERLAGAVSRKGAAHDGLRHVELSLAVCPCSLRCHGELAPRLATTPGPPGGTAAVSGHSCGMPAVVRVACTCGNRTRRDHCCKIGDPSLSLPRSKRGTLGMQGWWYCRIQRGRSSLP